MQFIYGVLQRLRKQGSVAHPYLIRAIEKSRNDGKLSGIAASQSLGLDRVMPSLSPITGIAPRPVSLRKGLFHFDYLHSDAPTNWFRDWLHRSLFDDDLTLVDSREVYSLLFDRLSTDGWLITATKESDEDSRPRGYLLDPALIDVTSEVTEFECDHCSRREVAHERSRSWVDGTNALDWHAKVH